MQLAAPAVEKGVHFSPLLARHIIHSFPNVSYPANNILTGDVAEVGFPPEAKFFATNHHLQI